MGGGLGTSQVLPWVHPLAYYPCTTSGYTPIPYYQCTTGYYPSRIAWVLLGTTPHPVLPGYYPHPVLLPGYYPIPYYCLGTTPIPYYFLYPGSYLHQRTSCTRVATSISVLPGTLCHPDSVVPGTLCHPDSVVPAR